MSSLEPRPSPEALLRAADRAGRGRLKIFLGAAPGVGKTFEMLREGAERLRDGTDVVIGLVETHGRAETVALVAPFEIVPRARLDHRGQTLEEMDLDAVLARAPALALVDEYAHTNAEGSRHPKRWQDVAELLDAGIDVWTTLNVQHVESLRDMVASFTRVRVRETVPDSVFEGAEIELVDLPPDELIERLRAGKVYVPAEATRALQHYFSRENLSALRELAMRRAALTVDRAIRDQLDAGGMVGAYGERVLVAVNELPGAEALVRTAKRLADALRAPWSAIFVETPRAAAFGDAERHRVADALRLAAGLGADIATVPADHVVTGLREQLAARRATQLVIGRSRRSRWFEWRHGSVVETMLRTGGGLAMHVIPAEDEAAAVRVPSTDPGWGALPGYAVAFGLVATTTLLGWAALPWLGTGSLDLLYLLPVLASAARYGLRPGIAAGILSALAYDYMFLPPFHTLSVTDPQGVVTLLMLVAVAGVTATLADRLRARATLGVRGAQENAALATFGQALARASDWEGSGRTICTEMAAILGVATMLLAERDGVLTPIAADPIDATLGAVERAAAEWTWGRGEPAGAGTATLTASDWQFHALTTAVGRLGVIGIARGDGRDPLAADRATLLQTLLGQISLALERLSLEADLRHVGLLEERDRLRAALLSSIGHDLRTPLAGVSAALDAIAAEHPDAAALPTARAEATRLRRFLDNLLGMVRADAGAIVPRPEPTDLTDAVAAAVAELRDLLRGNAIDFAVPADLPFVAADPVLLHHILLNLLANASVHGGEGGTITITGTRLRDSVTLEIRDRGPGLPPGIDVFDRFARGGGGDRRGGSGLGLAIVRAFASACAIEVRHGAAEGGGTRFTLVFPV